MTSSGPDVATRRAGRWLAALTAGLSITMLALAVTTPPRSGPFCSTGCVAYPYTAAAAYVPRDYLWMYPAVALFVVFPALTVLLYALAPPRVRPAAAIGVLLCGVAAAVILVDYGLQLAVVQPGLLRGETAGLEQLSQYNPHGVFIGLEDIGYALLAFGLVALAPALRRLAAPLGAVAAWISAAGGAGTVLLLIVLAAAYRARLDYRFEVFGLLVCLLVLAAVGGLLTVAFRPRSAPPARIATGSR